LFTTLEDRNDTSRGYDRQQTRYVDVQSLRCYGVLKDSQQFEETGQQVKARNLHWLQRRIERREILNLNTGKTFTSKDCVFLEDPDYIPESINTTIEASSWNLEDVTMADDREPADSGENPEMGEEVLYSIEESVSLSYIVLDNYQRYHS